ncbi:hypothetical protein ACQUZK_09720, partial [Streptococcus pyogenes]|uniref:hypothetical protein n=1 Tax=Streptococcus pyogenes TaxID=1314 RepID=UPI003DA0EA53
MSVLTNERLTASKGRADDERLQTQTKTVSMFAYATLGTNDPERAARFYDAVLGTLGIRRCGPEGADWLGWGTWENGGKTELALWVVEPFNGE